MNMTEIVLDLWWDDKDHGGTPGLPGPCPVWEVIRAGGVQPPVLPDRRGRRFHTRSSPVPLMPY